MQHTFWFAPGKLAGRSGPSKTPWHLPELRASGITAILSVNGGDFCHPKDIEQAGLRYLCQPLSPNAPPEQGDLEHCLFALPLALRFVRDIEDTGGTTLVHCHSGKDRTGLFMAYYAARIWKLPASKAIAAVKEARPIAFSAVGWEEFAFQVLTASGA